jgi:hypothetical protein
MAHLIEVVALKAHQRHRRMYSLQQNPKPSELLADCKMFNAECTSIIAIQDS